MSSTVLTQEGERLAKIEAARVDKINKDLVWGKAKTIAKHAKADFDSAEAKFWKVCADNAPEIPTGVPLFNVTLNEDEMGDEDEVMFDSDDLETLDSELSEEADNSLEGGGKKIPTTTTSAMTGRDRSVRSLQNVNTDTIRRLELAGLKTIGDLVQWNDDGAPYSEIPSLSAEDAIELSHAMARWLEAESNPPSAMDTISAHANGQGSPDAYSVPAKSKPPKAKTPKKSKVEPVGSPLTA